LEETLGRQLTLKALVRAIAASHWKKRKQKQLLLLSPL